MAVDSESVSLPADFSESVELDECDFVSLPPEYDDTNQLSDDDIPVGADDSVPTTALASQLFFDVVHDDVAEYYSPPRVLPVARHMGLRGRLSLDILTGWDFRNTDTQDLSIRLLAQVAVLILSPPCTIFSELQRLWNFKRIPKHVAESRWQTGMVYLLHAMRSAEEQHKAGRVFVFEHPARATSWDQPCVKKVAEIRQPPAIVWPYTRKPQPPACRAGGGWVVSP